MTMPISERLLGTRHDRPLPRRVTNAIRAQDEDSEVLICAVQIAAIALFALLYALSPKAFGPDVAFRPVPIALFAYGLFTGLRLLLALNRRLTDGFLALSVVIDIAVLMLTIWSFHIQYQQPPAIYLKAPTLLYVFIIIALRALRFDPRHVVLAGGTAATGWLVLLSYALWGQPMSAMITHDYAEYATSTKLLVGAEVDKVVSIIVVTGILAIVLVRARRMLIRSVAEAMASRELSRYFAPDIAASIVDAPERLEPGSGVKRQAAIMFIDLRGFTALSSRVSPDTVVDLLASYHATVLPIVHAHHGSVITYLGDGIMIAFGATATARRPAADALRATEDLLKALDEWTAAGPTDSSGPMRAGIGVTFGTVVCGTIGTEGRLEFATIGDPVNRAARLQGHTKSEAVSALVADEAWEQALADGYEPGRPYERRSCNVAGISMPIGAVAFPPDVRRDQSAPPVNSSAPPAARPR